MDTPHTVRRIISGALLSGGIAVAGLGLGAGTAQADDNGWGPAKQWCPGEPLPTTGNHVTDPFRGWDMSVCHTYYYVWSGMGNVSSMIWDGDNPPPKPPGSGFHPPPPLPPGLCWPAGSFIPVPIACP
jgi:hypothetical protein